MYGHTAEQKYRHSLKGQSATQLTSAAHQLGDTVEHVTRAASEAAGNLDDKMPAEGAKASQSLSL